MANILFLQDVLFEFIGPMQMSAMLKKGGHNTKLLIWTQEKDVWEEVKKISPDIIAFSVATGPHKEMLQMATKAKEFTNAVTVFGGPHPTFFPDVAMHPSVDVAVVGEGDYTFLSLADKIDRKEDWHDVPGIAFARDGGLVKTELPRLVENLEDLPFLDRELYYQRYEFLKNLPVKKFMSSRGCPFNCDFCYNKTIKRMYIGKGRWVRKRSVDNVIAEIKSIKGKYPLKSVRISDDTFTMDKKWLREWADKYPKEIGLPFTCLGIAPEIDDEAAKLLKQSGCSNIFFGVEAGDQALRGKILNKYIPDQAIINAANNLRNNKVKFGTYNMFGVPGETLETAIATVKLNAKIRPDYPYSTVFQPYPATDIVEYAIKNGFMDESFSYDSVEHMTETNVVKLKDKAQIMNLQRLIFIGARFPFSIPLLVKVSKLNTPKLFKAIYDLCAGYTRMRAFGSDWWNSLKLAIAMHKRV
jgi:anaerobic magnesium-protoporphyrin IX monomethyl ester cyclase